VRKASIAVEERQEKAKNAEEAVEKQGEDADWLDRGLKDEIKKSKGGLRQAVSNLRMANAAESASRLTLEEAKERYLQAVKKSKRWQKRTDGYKKKLRKHDQAHEANQTISISKGKLRGALPKKAVVGSDITVDDDSHTL